MKNKSTYALLVAALAVCFGAQFKTCRAESFAQRREKLLDMLTDRKMLELNPSDKKYSYRVRWQYYHACLAMPAWLKGSVSPRPIDISPPRKRSWRMSGRS